MNLSNNIVSLIRTYTPALIGLVAGWAVAKGLPVSTSAEVALTPVLSGAFIAVYYAGARYLESRWPAFGWLLGVAKQPTYVGPLVIPVRAQVTLTPGPFPPAATATETAPEPPVITTHEGGI
jgi:hypothetical protein